MACWCISGPEASPGPSHSLPARFSESDSSDKNKGPKGKNKETTKNVEKKVLKHQTKDKKKDKTDKKKKVGDDDDEAASDPPSSDHRPVGRDDDDADGDDPAGVARGSRSKEPNPTKKPASKGAGTTRRPSKRPASKKHDSEPVQDPECKLSCYSIGSHVSKHVTILLLLFHRFPYDQTCDHLIHVIQPVPI